MSTKIVYPGISTGKTYLVSEVIISSKQTFSIESVLFGDKKVSDYSLQNMKSNIFVDVKKNSFEEGEYKLIFKTDYVEDLNDNTEISITLNSDGNLKTITKDVIVDKSKSVHLK